MITSNAVDVLVPGTSAKLARLFWSTYHRYIHLVIDAPPSFATDAFSLTLSQPPSAVSVGLGGFVPATGVIASDSGEALPLPALVDRAKP